MAPTSHPTLNRKDYTDNAVYQWYNRNHTYFEQTESTLTFGSFYYKGIIVDGTCNAWDQFINTQLSLPFDGIQFDNIVGLFKYYDFSNRKTTYTQYTCSQSNVVESLMQNLKDHTDYVAACGVNYWRTYSCDGNIILCVNCRKNCGYTCPSSQLSLLNPCVYDNCDEYVASGSLINVQYSYEILYPQFLTPYNYTTVYNNNMTLSLNISSIGIITCAAFDKTSKVTLTSTVDIDNIGYKLNYFNSSENVTSYLVELTILDLSPDTTYSVYCYTADYKANIMPLSEVLDYSIEVTTLCCRQLSLVTEPIITQFVSGSGRSEVPFYVKLDAIPYGEVTVTLTTVLVNCATGNKISGFANAVPSVFDFSSKSASLSGTFVIRASVGCVTIAASASSVASASGTTDYYLSTSTKIVSQNLRLAPPLPALSSSYISNDGLQLHMTFNSDTNRAANYMANYASSFNCSRLVIFDGSNAVSCRWNSPKELIAQLSSVQTLLSTNNYVTLMKNRVQAACVANQNCKSYNYIDRTTVAVQFPSNPISPVVELKATRMLSSCDDFVVDPTSSNGNVGSAWTEVVWYVDGYNSTFLSDYLNAHYQTTDEPVVIPNEFLHAYDASIGASGTYTIYLKLTNAFSRSSINSVSVVISSLNIQPTITLSVGSTLKRYLNETLRVTAIAAIPQCSGKSRVTRIGYAWKLFKDGSLMTDVVSESNDDKVFVLPAHDDYFDDKSALYVLQAVATVKDSGLVASTFSKVSVQLGSCGVKAVISGSEYKTITQSKAFRLDATDSYDIDYPSKGIDGLSFTWSCITSHPSYGQECDNLPFLNTSTLTLKAYSLTALYTYQITVAVKNSAGKVDTTSTLLKVTRDTIPSIEIEPFTIKLNPSDKVILSATVTGTESMITTWTLPTSNVTFKGLQYYDMLESNPSIALTPLTSTFPPGAYVVQLSLSPNYFVGGLSYTFLLSTAYAVAKDDDAGSFPTAVSRITITMNTPPYDGTLSITPSLGLALNTSFTLRTIKWVDDLDDYPLQYTFGYYRVSLEYDKTVIRSSDTIHYTSSYLSAGSDANNYFITCFVQASDKYGAVGSETMDVQVNPISNSAFKLALNNTLQYADIADDSTQVGQVVTAAVQFLNYVECMNAPSCTLLKRQSCRDKTNTCGPCLDGYYGVTGDANTLCSKSAALGGEPCIRGTDCISGSCSTDRTCEYPQKSCPNDCFETLGVCSYYSFNGQRVSSCRDDDTRCYATCECNKGKYGADCYLSSYTIVLNQQYRERLCTSISKIVDSQDVTADLILSRATSIADIMLDITQITDDALATCTSVLLSTVKDNLEYIGSDSNTVSIITKALSNVLAFGNSLSEGMLSDISDCINNIVSSSQNYIAINEPPQSYVTNNMRLTTAVASIADLGYTNYTTAQSELEIYSKVSAPSIAFDNGEGASGALGVTVVQLTSNPYGIRINASFVGVSTVLYDGTSPSSRRRLSTPSNINMYIKTLNDEPVDYSDVLYPSIVVYQCNETKAFEPYEYTGKCPEWPDFTIKCPGTKGYFTVSCPGRRRVGTCLMYDDTTKQLRENNSTCTAVAFDDYTTTCKCSNLVNNRRLTGGGNAFLFFSSSYKIFRTSFDQVWTQGPILPKVEANTIILSALGGIILILAAGICGYTYLDWRELRRAAFKKMLETDKSIRTVQTFFDSIFPDEFKQGQWHTIFWHWLQLEHSWLCLILPYRSDRQYRAAKWVLCMCRLIVFLFLNTIIAYYFYSDDGTCEVIKTKSECDVTYSPLDVRLICNWRSDLNYCMYQPPTLDLQTTLYLTVVVTTIAVPIDHFIEWMISHIMVLIKYRVDKIKSKIIPTLLQSEKDNNLVVQSNDEDNNKDPEYTSSPNNKQLQNELVTKDEFSLAQSYRSNLLRGARLDKAQKTMDFVLPVEEASMILMQAEADAEKTQNHMIFKGAVDNFSFKQLRYGFTGKSFKKDDIIKRLYQSRKTADYIRSEVERLESNEDREKFLMRQFIIDNFTGYRREIVRRYMMKGFESVHYATRRSIVRLASLIMLPALLLIMLVVIYQYNLTIGSRAAEMWLLVIIVSLLEDIFFLEPLKIWIKWVVLTSTCGPDIRNIFNWLKLRGRIVLMRTRGLMRDSNALIQHFNPACRASRMFPSLPISRFLMTLSDFDIPLRKKYSIIGLPIFVVSTVLFVTANFPVHLQDISIHMLTCICFNLIIIFLHNLGSSNPNAMIAIILVIVLGIFGREAVIHGTAYHKHIVREAAARENMFDDIDSITDKEGKEDDDQSMTLTKKPVDYGSYDTSFLSKYSKMMKPMVKRAVPGSKYGTHPSMDGDSALDSEVDSPIKQKKSHLFPKIPNGISDIDDRLAAESASNIIPEEQYIPGGPEDDNSVTNATEDHFPVSYNTQIQYNNTPKLQPLRIITGPPILSRSDMIVGPALQGRQIPQAIQLASKNNETLANINNFSHMDIDALSFTTAGGGSAKYRAPPASLPPSYASKRPGLPPLSSIRDSDSLASMTEMYPQLPQISESEQEVKDDRVSSKETEELPRIRRKKHDRNRNRSGHRERQYRGYSDDEGITNLRDRGKERDKEQRTRSEATNNEPQRTINTMSVSRLQDKLPPLQEIDETYTRNRNRRRGHSSRGRNSESAVDGEVGPGAQSSKYLQARANTTNPVASTVRNTNYLEINGDLSMSPLIDSLIPSTIDSPNRVSPSATEVQAQRFPMWH